MYKLLNFLFGYDYIAWRNLADAGIARVFRNKNGDALYCRYKNIKVFDIITHEDQVVWLTCKSGKYLYIEKPYKTINNITYINNKN